MCQWREGEREMAIAAFPEIVEELKEVGVMLQEIVARTST
jgi:hypothetical protein